MKSKTEAEFIRVYIRMWDCVISAVFLNPIQALSLHHIYCDNKNNEDCENL